MPRKIAIDNMCSRTGSALYIALVMGVVLLGFGGSMLSVSTMNTNEVTTNRDQIKRLHLAKTGVRRAILDMSSGGEGNLGVPQEGIAFGSGAFWTTTSPEGGGIYTIRSRGHLQTSARVIEAVVRRASGVFDHAIFAGNSSEDPGYSLDFGGTGLQADEIYGDVYSGQDVLVEGNAAVSGAIRASGNIHGATGSEGIQLPILDIAGMNYAANNDVDVAAQFNEHATYRYDNAGGSAWQLPSHLEGHIFRKNPSDRQAEYQGTAKDDYFLEDPYEDVNVDRNQNGSDAYAITLTGGGQPGPYGNQKVYFIDGNLWIHNKRSFSFKLLFDQPEGLQVTFVVRGNIYISDNLFYGDPLKDGAALIAIRDENVADSGNIYFGDPVFGTLRQMNAFMYAENNFYDNNLDAEGSAAVTLNGIMSAGNHVDINRDYGTQHSKLTVNYDDRVSRQTIDLPGLPRSEGGRLDYTVISWREVGGP